jgi:hypothetical protein
MEGVKTFLSKQSEQAGLFPAKMRGPGTLFERQMWWSKRIPPGDKKG